MNRLQRNPILQVAKCEMCPNQVTNFVTGLCGRCSSIWAGKRQLGRMTVSPYQVMAATVSLARCSQEPQQMHPTFRRAIEKTKSLRSQKVELFQKVRNQFLDSILTEPFADQQPRLPVVEDDYWNVPEIADRDYLMFQKNIDLLGELNLATPTDSDLNNNKVPEK